MTECVTCELIARRDAGNAPLWDSIHRTAYWDVVHSFNTSLLGWLVLVSRRHIAAVDEMTEAEAIELGKLIRQVSIILKNEVGCAKTYVVQFAEAEGHPHVHFHIIPRMPDQADEFRGPRIFQQLGVPDDARVGEVAMNDLAERIRRNLVS
ncbi:MAG: HIT family protein [Anaerolineae bacterium]|nr:HIT family protein [Anaerolineae bacterium]